jgi:dTDP-4-dehydrorhamnose reductase
VKVIVTGAGGQLGYDLVRTAVRCGWEVHGYSRTELDVTNLDAVKECVAAVKPDVIIHAAAYTKVDLAEQEPDLAYLANALGTRNVAISAEAACAKLCYISTDYVFDGNADTPYREYDQTNPLSVYGKTKLAGEKLVESLSSRYYIVRTAWVYGRHGSNFVKTMLRLAAEQSELRVVDDQIGSPTYTVDLAEFLVDLVQTENYGIYHATNSGMCSWYEFARTILAMAGVSSTIHPVSTAEFPRPAPRPKFSVLDHMAIRANGFRDLRHWRDGLTAYFAEGAE